MKTVVAILNWNGQKLLEAFLPGVVEHSAHLAEIAVIDNASTDESVNWLKAHYPAVRIVQNESNGGFAKGYNLGLAALQADLFILLNSDVEVTQGWLEPLLETMQNPDVAAAQPKILSYQNRNQFEYAGAAGGFIDKDGFVFCRGRMFNHFEVDSGQYNDQREVFWATGACLAVKSSEYWSVGGLDEDFFAHMEEIDLCWRLKNSGKRIMYNGASTVFHMGGGTLSKINPRKTYLNFRNNLFLLLKNYRTGNVFFKMIWRMKLDALAAAKFLFELQPAHFLAVLRAHFSFYRQVPKVLRKRKKLSATVHSPNLHGFYTRSIVWQYFVKGKKQFSDLNSSDFTQ